MVFDPLTPEVRLEYERPREVDESYLDGFMQLPGESGDAYQRFLEYRNTGAGRTFAAIANAYGVASDSISAQARRNHWITRATAYDRFLAEIERNTLVEEARKQSALVAERRRTLMETEWATSQALLEKAKAMIAWPLARQEISKDGKTYVVIPQKWSQMSMTNLIELASQLGRRSLEMPTSYSQVEANITTTDGPDVATAHLTPEERVRFDEAQKLAAQVFAMVMSGASPEQVMVEGTLAPEKHEAPAWYQPGHGPLPLPEKEDEDGTA